MYIHKYKNVQGQGQKKKGEDDISQGAKTRLDETSGTDNMLTMALLSYIIKIR